MNRLKLLEQTLPSDSSAGDRPLLSLTQTSTVGQLCHGVFVPLHYEPNYSYPLLIWLHGPDADERQIRDVMPLVSMRNYVAIAPRGISPGTFVTDRAVANNWAQTADGIQDATSRVLDCIEVASERFNIARHRVFLAGHLSGGTMALRVSLANPHIFAGAASLGGSFPSGNAPLTMIQSARQLELMIGNGRANPWYPEDHVCNDLRLMHAAGLSITLRQYPCEEELASLMLHDLNVWIMEQVTGCDSRKNQQTWPQYESLN